MNKLLKKKGRGCKISELGYVMTEEKAEVLAKQDDHERQEQELVEPPEALERDCVSTRG